MIHAAGFFIMYWQTAVTGRRSKPVSYTHLDTFLNGMMNAAETPIFQECISVLHELFPAEKAAIDAISPRISRSVTRCV